MKFFVVINPYCNEKISLLTIANLCGNKLSQQKFRCNKIFSLVLKYFIATKNIVAIIYCNNIFVAISYCNSYFCCNKLPLEIYCNKSLSDKLLQQ